MTKAPSQIHATAEAPDNLPLWREPATWLALMGAIGGLLVLYLAGDFDPLIMG